MRTPEHGDVDVPDGWDATEAELADAVRSWLGLVDHDVHREIKADAQSSVDEFLAAHRQPSTTSASTMSESSEADADASGSR